MGHMTHADVNTGGLTNSVDYAYNPAGKRYMRTEAGVTKLWTYDGDNIASVEDTTSPTLHSVYSGSGLAGVTERDDVNTAGAGSTTSRFYLYNHRGDVVGICDAAGHLACALDYDAYGTASEVTNGGSITGIGDILFTGKDLDPDTGLYYFNARWYDPECGRFVSRTGLAPSIEESYEFCDANPITWTDPQGEDIWIEGGVHLRICVGNPNNPQGSIYTRCYSYGLTSRLQMFNPFKKGIVYRDCERGGKIRKYLKTSSDEDAEAQEFLDSVKDQRGRYGLTYNCRTFSYQMYNFLKNDMHMGEEVTPPTSNVRGSGGNSSSSSDSSSSSSDSSS